MQRKLVKLGGKTWAIEAQALDGLCDPNTKTIHLPTELRGQRLLETILHESLHACQPKASEATVERTATELGGVLWGLGFRRVEL